MKYVYWILGLVVLAGIGWLASQSRPVINNSAVEMAEVIVNSPTANSTIASPLTVSGTAVGNWYFEASFPIQLLNASNQVVGTGLAEAQSDWMTSSPVPFNANIIFPTQTPGSSGSLVLHKDNPSGDSQNDDSFTVPVMF